jgi:hypothetical protein
MSKREREILGDAGIRREKKRKKFNEANLQSAQSRAAMTAVARALFVQIDFKQVS